MEAANRNSPQTYPDGAQPFKGVSLILLLGMYGAFGPDGEKSNLLHGLNLLQELVTGRLPLEDMDALRQSAQLLHFLLETMF
jgi:hypothetical protein